MAPLTRKVCSSNCFVCCKKFEVEMSSENYKKQNQVCEQFWVLVSRYFNLNNVDQSNIIFPEKTMEMFKIGTQNKNRKKRLNSCESCLPLLESICMVYKDWNNLQLRLNRNIQLIAKLMQDVSVIGDNADDNFKEAIDFRQRFINQALDKRSSKDFPHLLLKRLSIDSLQLFRKNDNRNNLNYSSVDDELSSAPTPNVASNPDIKVEPEPTLEQIQVKAEEGFCAAEDSDSDMWQPSDLYIDDDDDEANDNDGIIDRDVESNNPKDSPNANNPSDNETSKNFQTCGKVFLQNSHANSKLLKCRFCPRGYNRENNRRYHEKKCDYNPKVPFVYKCGICDKKFCQYSKCYSHQIVDHEGQIPRVIKLDKVENKNADWRPDVAVSNDADVADDQNEAAAVPTPTEYTHKQGQKKPKPYKCKLCGNGFSGKYNLELHMKTHTQPTRLFKCPFCQRGYKKSYTRNFHARRCASNPEKTTTTGNNATNPFTASVNKYKCYECDDTTFFSPKRLTEHIKKEHGGKSRFPCKICGQVFLKHSRLNYHNQSKHLNPTKPDPFPCQFCCKTFAKKVTLSNHERRYCKNNPDRSKPLQTSKPAKQGIDSSDPVVLDISNPKDTTDTFPCQFCGKQCTLRRQRRYHESMLCKLNPANAARLVCETCGKDLPNRAAYHKHMYHHRLEKGPGFPCSVCGKTFKLSDQRNIHERGHNEPAYACGYCGEKFIWDNSCRNHIKSKHKGQTLVGRVVNLLKESLPASLPVPVEVTVTENPPVLVTENNNELAN